MTKILACLEGSHPEPFLLYNCLLLQGLSLAVSSFNGEDILVSFGGYNGRYNSEVKANLVVAVASSGLAQFAFLILLFLLG